MENQNKNVPTVQPEQATQTRRDAMKSLTSALSGATLLRASGATLLGASGAALLGINSSAEANNAEPIVKTREFSATGAKLTGRLVTPTSATYENDRLGWDKYFSTYPSVICYVQNTDDVANALAWSRETGTAMRVRAGGHCLEGWNSVTGGITIDVSSLKSIKLDKENMTATVGTGVNQGELWAALAGTGLGFPTGEADTVGLGGVLLGGGIGVLAASYGVACDSLLAVEMVIASGKTGASVIQADLNQNSDLLWACRGGGGGNFGITTSYTVQLHPITPKVVVWGITWPFAAFQDAFEAWQSWAPTADTRLGSTFNVIPPQTASQEVQVDGIFVGTEAELGDLLSPLTKIPGAQVKKAFRTFAENFVITNADPDPATNWLFRSSWTYKKLPKEALDIVVDFMKRTPNKDCAWWSLSWGGKVRTPPKGGSAFFHRDPLFYSEPGVGWTDPSQTSACIAWSRAFGTAMRAYTQGSYVNVPDRAITDWGNSYYGTNFDRLKTIKSKYDPNEVFKFEQSIPLA